MSEPTSRVVVLLWLAVVGACGPEPRHTGDDCTPPDPACPVCVPHTGTCTGSESHACNDQGTGYVDTTCDPMQGETCDPNTGECVGLCAPQNLGSSYIGCEYFPTVTGNMVSADYHFAVAIANTTSEVANIIIEGGALTAPESFTVGPNSVGVKTLPWQAALKLCVSNTWANCLGMQTDAALAVGGSYHLRSSAPVTVYQFNPLEYTLPSAIESSFTNDASLLLPVNVWRSSYYAAAWQQSGGTNPSELAVTAQFDGTEVTITSKAATNAAGGAPAFTPGVPQMVTLNKGDVIEITSRTGDLTGSLVSSSKPVQLISGHYCANIPDGVAACDHIEESMFSVDALGRRYIVNAPAVTTIPGGKVEVIRVIATQANTQLTYDPPQPGAPGAIAAAGDFVEIADTAASFMITADQKILVAQYMEGQDAGGNTGDPAMALAVPVEQFRTSYLFHAPPNYESNYVDVTAPAAASVMLDGSPVTFTPIGTTGYGLARIYPLTAGPAGDGNHKISGNGKFGITVYGYGMYTSYWYPGGLDLTDIIQ